MKKLTPMRVFLSFLILLFFLNGNAQSIVQTRESWTQFTFTGRIHTHWSLYIDVVDRFNQFGASENTVFFRPAVLFHLNEKVNVGAGYCYAILYPGEALHEITDEQRPWQQLQVSHGMGRFAMQHRIRLEERFNHPVRDGHAEHGYKETWRLRYKLSMQYPLVEFCKGNFGLSMSNEFFSSYGKNASSWFNQNRLFMGIGMEWKNGVSVSAGVTDIYRTVGGNYNNVIAPTLNVNVKLDWRRGK